MIASKQLIKKLYTHNQDAFCEIYNIYHNLVYYVIYSIVKDKEATQELVQDTFVKMWNNIYMFDYNSNFKAWLLTIAKNTARDYLRVNKSVELVEEVELAGNCRYMKDLYEFNTDTYGILSEFEYNVIVLSLVYNMKRREVAEYLERPLGTILRVYKEAITKLKKLYEITDNENK